MLRESKLSRPARKSEGTAPMRRVYTILAPRAYSIIIFGALFCTVAVKLFHAQRMQLIGEYVSWILADVAVLVGIEAVLTAIYFGLRRRWAFRIVTIVAAILCTWSVMNGGWIIRTGTQILPAVLLPVVLADRDAGPSSR